MSNDLNRPDFDHNNDRSLVVLVVAVLLVIMAIGAILTGGTTPDKPKPKPAPLPRPVPMLRVPATDAFDPSLPVSPDHGAKDDGHADFGVLASAPAWGRGWPNCETGRMRKASGGNVSVNIDYRLAELTGLLLAETNARGYRLDQSQTGAFVCRPIGGTQSASLHSFGTALDINWRENEFSNNPRYTIPRWAIDLWKSYGWSWGGDWSGKKDTMHFERTDTPASAGASLARYKADRSTATVPTTSAPTTVPSVLQTAASDGVYTAAVDGYWLAGADGGVFALGGAPFLGSLPGLGVRPSAPVVSITALLDGYVLLGEDGAIYSFNAPFWGSFFGKLPPGRKAKSLLADPAGTGLLVTLDDGAVWGLGNPRFYGSVYGP